MKSLVEYIQEELANTVEVQEVNESNEKWYRFTTTDLEDASIIDNIKNIANTQGFYVENIDNGIKIRVDADKVNGLTPIADFIETKIDACKEDEKRQELCEKLEKLVADMRKDVTDADAKAAEEAEKKAKEEEEAKQAETEK
jgi:hypothetical protein